MTSPRPAATRRHRRCRVAQALRSPQFIILLATNFLCCATHSGPIIHTVSYAVTCGIPMMAAVTIYSVEGLAGMGGRIAFGLLGDRFGAKRVLVSGLLAQAFGALAYVFVRELAAFYAVAALFGFIYAGTMPLYAVLMRENFPLRIMGTVIGGTAMAGSLGMATGPLAGGLIYDTFASYAWLYIGSWAVGLGAFLIAMTFRPFPKEDREQRSLHLENSSEPAEKRPVFSGSFSHGEMLPFVMAGLVPAIHVFLAALSQDVDARHRRRTRLLDAVGCARADSNGPGMTGAAPVRPNLIGGLSEALRQRIS